MNPTDHMCPYLNYRDSAREVMDFYASVFGGEVTRSTLGEYGMGTTDEENARIMHSQLVVDGKTMLMAADTPDSMEVAPSTTTLAIFGGQAEDATLREWWAALAEGGTVPQPLETAPWGDAFGQVVDRFGTPWYFNIAAQQAGDDVSSEA